VNNEDIKILLKENRMEKITSILVPVDGSAPSKKALEYAGTIAGKFNAAVSVLHVYEMPIPVTGYEYSSRIFESLADDLKKYAEDIVEEAEKQLGDSGLKINKLILVGSQGYQIIEAAKGNNCDLIIMGSRGLGTIKSFLLGSVSNYVVHHAKTPVLLVH
jgi:nucleotide-binding universal stress UspA family protein